MQYCDDVRDISWAFDETWEHLSLEGACDVIGGAEHRRVLASWIAAGRPRGIGAYIRTLANLASDGTGDGRLN